MDGKVISLENEGRSTYYYYIKAITLAAILATVILLPFVANDRGIFLYYGDYNVQQLPFYQHAVQAVHEGNFAWDWYSDLGSNFIGSYSYYLVGSPFFWLYCLFPADWSCYLMAPVYVLKYMTAALFAYAYLKRFVRNKDYAVIGALLYAFSGFQIYNTFFNQFHEVVAFFPLLLIGIEESMQNNRRGLFALAVAFNAAINYFMFAGQVVFCFIYFFFRCTDMHFRLKLKNFLLLAFESVLGVMLACVVFLPACLGLLGNTRLDRHFSKLKDMLLYQTSGKFYYQRYGSIISSFFFPPDIPSRANFFPENGARWGSVAIWIPLFGMSGVFAFIRAKLKSWISKTVIFLIICSLVPLLNSTFFLLNNSYYARWFYMMNLIMVIATIKALDDEKISFKGGLAVNAICCAAFAIPLGFMWYKAEDKSDYAFGKPEFIDRFWVYVIIAFACIIAVWLITKFLRGKKAFIPAAYILVAVTIVGYGINHLAYGKNHTRYSTFLIDNSIKGEIVLEDDTDFFRIDTYGTSDNMGLYWHYPSIQFFHTVVPASIMEFYPYFNVTRNVASRPEKAQYGLRPFLSVKYLLIEAKNSQKHDMPGFVYIDEQDGYKIYENQYYIPMGFTYDEFMTYSEADKVTKGSRHALTCTYMFVDDEDAEFFSKYMTEVKKADAKSATQNTLVESAVERAEGECCSSFEWYSDGFTAEITLEKANAVFFSVPYDDGGVSGFEGDGIFKTIIRKILSGGGWKATVNGEEVEIKKVFQGLSSVVCEAGKNEIVFEYKTPGLKVGVIITIIAALVWILYMIISRKKGEKATYRFIKEDYYEDEDAPLLKHSKKKKDKEEQATLPDEKTHGE